MEKLLPLREGPPLSMLVLVEKGELWLPRRVGVVLAGEGVVAHQFLVQWHGVAALWHGEGGLPLGGRHL